MKRLGMFLLICTVLCACSACKKENRSAQELTTRQATNAEAEQTISGLSVRVPATQYRLVRTEPELMDFGERLLPYDAGVVLTGAIFAQGEEGKASEAAAFYAPDRSCVVQPLPVSLDGRLVQTALNGEQVFSLEASAQQDQPRWVLRGPNMQSSLDAALTGCSNITAMMIRDDTAYLAVDDAWVIACLLDGTLLWKQEAPAIDRFFTAEDGRMLAWARQEQTLYMLEDDIIRFLCPLPDLFCTGIEQLYVGDQTPYDCIVCANDAFFGWSIDEEAVTQLFVCDTVGLYANDILDFCSLGNDRYVGLEWSPSAAGDPGCTLFWLTPVEGELPERRTIRAAGFGSGIVSMAIRDFASMYPEYQIETMDYYELYGEQAGQQLIMDMLYGDCPDLLFVNGLPFEQFARRGLLEDLYMYIDADGTISRADLVENLLLALETDGKLYCLPQTYQLGTAAGLPELVGGQTAWSMEAFLDTAQAHPELSAVFAQEDGASMLTLLLAYAPEAFVDYEKAEASFDSPEFLRLLALAGKQRQPEAETDREALLTGQVLLEPLTIARTQDFDMQFADELQLLAFPGFPGAGRADFYLTLPMAIPVNAREKAGAWAFLKLLITEARYAARGRGGWLPLQTDFDEKTSAMTVPEAKKLLCELQTEATSAFYYDAALEQILVDELPYFLSGDQTAGQIAARIQRRAQLYLDETYR